MLLDLIKNAVTDILAAADLVVTMGGCARGQKWITDAMEVSEMVVLEGNTLSILWLSDQAKVSKGLIWDVERAGRVQ